MSIRDKQERLERSIFDCFVSCAELQIPASSVHQLGPPSPGIVCNLDGQDEYGFELTSITDSHIEKKVRGRVKGKQYSNYKIEIEDVVCLIARKSSKTYQASCVDLLIHEAATPIDDLWMYEQSTLDSRLQAATNSSIFERVWLFDETNNLMRCYRKTAQGESA